MKSKILKLLTLTVLIVLSSCSKDDELINDVNQEDINPKHKDTTIIYYDDYKPNTQLSKSNFNLNSRWTKTNLTYYFKNGTTDISGNDERNAIKQAFDLWEEVTPLTFTQVFSSSSADIIIAFETGDHGDGSPFDDGGSFDSNGNFSNILAHAFSPPPFSGDIHFDDYETWTLNTRPSGSGNPFDLVTVAAHEIGHSLGLGHSDVVGSLMYASYDGSHRFLHEDDINAISSLYPFEWTTDYTLNKGWSVSQHPRTLADVNGDGKDDIVGFASNGVRVSLSNGNNTFGSPQLWIGYYGQSAGGWSVHLHPRVLADVNGDGKSDVVGFANGSVLVSLSNGSSFGSPTTWINDFTKNAGWSVDQHPRVVSDVNGDGKADIVGFASGSVRVALSNGSSFNSPTTWINDFTKNAGWSVSQHPRMVSDVNGDGKADIVGFASDGVKVSYSSGSSFNSSIDWVDNYGQNINYGVYSSGWSVHLHPRVLADVDNDGKSDIIGFSDDAVVVTNSNL